VREYLLVLLVAAGVTWLLTPLVRRLALATGAVAEPRDRDVHTEAIPRLGGLAMYGGICAAFAVAHSLPALSAIFKYSDVWAVIVAGGFMCLLGIADDRWELDSVTKLAGQTVAAGIMVLFGLQLLTVTFPGVGAISLGTEGVPLTVLLVLLTVNAVNFIDGLDGLLAGVGAIAALALFSFSYGLASGRVTFGVAQERISAPTLIAVVLAGACLGFLPHNFNPARIFMGDSGAMLLGLLLASSTIAVTGQIDPAMVSDARIVPAFFPVLVPVAVLLLPLTDLLLAVVRRIGAGSSPFTADRMHLHHRLLDLGHTHARAVLIMYLWTSVMAFGAVSLAFVPLRTGLPVWGAAILVTLLLTLGPLRGRSLTGRL
jgi:UDP-GlcNAc:undecaprenyl-phosphate GlcNAc-1-phosphate transferase